MIKIRYSSSKDLTAGICYADGLIVEFYLDVDVGKPKYIYSEDGDEDLSGDFIRSFARIEKQYTIETYLQEYMVDAVFALQLHDNVEVLLSNGTNLIVDEFRVSDPEWDEAEGLAKVVMTFVIYTEISNNSCSTAIDCDINAPTLTAMSVSGTVAYCDYEEYVTGLGGTIIDEQATRDIYEELGVGTLYTYIITGGTTDDNTFVEVFMKVGGGAWVSQGTISSSIYNGSGVKASIYTEECGYAQSIYFKVAANRWGCTAVESTVWEFAV